MAITAQQIADAWVKAWETAPAPQYSPFLRYLGGAPRQTYRESLDEQPRNHAGHLIPRIAIMRRNLRLYTGPTRLFPQRFTDPSLAASRHTGWTREYWRAIQWERRIGEQADCCC